MNIPATNLKRVIIIGAGFGGLQIAKKLSRKHYQIVLIDKNNYHNFQPLLYQVATAGLEPDSIAHGIRTIIKKTKNFFFRLAEVLSINPAKNEIDSTIGKLSYDYLILAMGSKTNYFGNKNLEKLTLPMKSIPEALNLRSLIFQNFEAALLTNQESQREKLMTFVIAGGGPTGVELAGALAEMKNFILPHDYPDLDLKKMNIHLIQATSRLLDGMSEGSARMAYKYLKKMGVNILFNSPVRDYDGEVVYLDSEKIPSSNLIWAAGVKGVLIEGMSLESIEKGRFLVDEFSKVKGYKNIFSIGDVALMKEEKKYSNGYPMVAQPALQQGENLARNLNRLALNQSPKPFKYKDLGSMATIGRNKAVCDLPFWNWRLKGFIAWIAWMFVHLVNLVGFRNKMIALINWIIQYFQYNKSVRLIIRPYERPKKE